MEHITTHDALMEDVSENLYRLEIDISSLRTDLDSVESDLEDEVSVLSDRINSIENILD